MHVLLAEDNNVNQRIFTKLFNKVGCSFAIVNNGREALDYLASPACPPPDIILMDIAMPVMSGFEATEIIRTRLPFTNNPKLQMTPIIALAAHILRGDGERLIQKGFTDALSKPVRWTHLTQILSQYFQYQPTPVGPGSPMLKMTPVWGPLPLRKFRGPRSRL
ncbi:CheY-like protein [Aspergillus campestris IBT 28561]|uniref:CheY-like protein n=1 Tax=Aspergillus campestris (strain IBT 28561) TaxID=1392248 RepID=A0A2I1CXN4_ASPC2|nr:CheY-like protein [Aspergillus campestris IBT 28561]PKY02390.1 CheY-like protein [Aspergillus campestris IBT 28561]